MKRQKTVSNPESTNETIPDSAIQESASSVETGSTEETLSQQSETFAPTMSEAAEEPPVEAIEGLSESEKSKTGFGAFSLPEAMSSMSQQANKAIYGAFYYSSYSIVFSTLMVANMIPMNNVIGQAIKKGASDAKHALEKSEETLGMEEQMPSDVAAMNA